jgi:hypothetical protein
LQWRVSVYAMQRRRRCRGTVSAMKERQRARKLTSVLEGPGGRCSCAVVAREMVPVGCSRRCLALIRGGWGSRRKPRGVCGPLHRGNMLRHATTIAGGFGRAVAGRATRDARGRLHHILRRALRIKMRSAAVPCGLRELTRAPNGEGVSFRAPYVNRESYYGI